VLHGGETKVVSRTIVIASLVGRTMFFDLLPKKKNTSVTLWSSLALEKSELTFSDSNSIVQRIINVMYLLTMISGPQFRGRKNYVGNTSDPHWSRFEKRMIRIGPVSILTKATTFFCVQHNVICITIMFQVREEKSNEKEKTNQHMCFLHHHLYEG